MWFSPLRSNYFVYFFFFFFAVQTFCNNYKIKHELSEEQAHLWLKNLLLIGMRTSWMEQNIRRRDDTETDVRGRDASRSKLNVLGGRRSEHSFVCHWCKPQNQTGGEKKKKAVTFHSREDGAMTQHVCLHHSLTHKLTSSTWTQETGMVQKNPKRGFHSELRHHVSPSKCSQMVDCLFIFQR